MMQISLGRESLVILMTLADFWTYTIDKMYHILKSVFGIQMQVYTWMQWGNMQGRAFWSSLLCLNTFLWIFSCFKIKFILKSKVAQWLPLMSGFLSRPPGPVWSLSLVLDTKYGLLFSSCLHLKKFSALKIPFMERE